MTAKSRTTNREVAGIGAASPRFRDLAVQIWPIDKLIPYARNARTHTDEQVAQVADSEHKDVTVWEVDGVQLADRRLFKHSTPKPVELFRRPILKHLRPWDIAYEPFAGSGPQFVAAELTGRRCFGLELEPAHCDVIVKRWEKLTGKKAQLA